MSFEPSEIFPELATQGTTEAVRTDGHALYHHVFKRVMDIALVLLVVPVVLPVVLLIALLVMRDGHLPFYWSARVGRNGRVFRMMKLRSMVHNADAKLEACLSTDADAAAEWASMQKLKHDPRITNFGRLLRKTSLDELPQLWNVVKGDMSLVGPRPMMPSQRKIYPGSAYYAMRPGVTGPWQVSDRNETTFAKRADFDLDYARNLSFTNDVKLIARTIAVVLRCTGY